MEQYFKAQQDYRFIGIANAKMTVEMCYCGTYLNRHVMSDNSAAQKHNNFCSCAAELSCMQM